MCWRKQDFIVSQLRSFGFTQSDWWPISRKDCRASVSQACRSVQIIYLNHEDLRGRQAEGNLAKETWLSMKVQIDQTNKKNDFSPLLFPSWRSWVGSKAIQPGLDFAVQKERAKDGYHLHLTADDSADVIVNDIGVSPQNHLRGADLEARHKWKSLHVPVNFTSWDLVTVKHPKCFFSSFFAKSIQFLEVCNAIMTIKLYSLSHFLELEWSLTISFHVVCPHNSNRDEPSPARQIRYLSGCDDDQRPGFVCGCIKWKNRFVMQWS